MQKISTFLWYDNHAEEAVKFYTSVFDNAKIVSTHRDGKKVMSVTFQLNGQKFIAFNGGPHFKFTAATSIFVEVKTQREVDALWEKFSMEGEPVKCGWIKDKFGLSWQIIPSALLEMLNDKDKSKSERVFQAMLKMVKIEVKTLQKAYDNK